MKLDIDFSRVKKMKSINYIFVMIFLLASIISPSTSVTKGIVLSVGILIGMLILEVFNLNFKKKIVFLLAFTLPFNLMIYQGVIKDTVNLAGAKNTLLFNFYDLLIITIFVISIFEKSFRNNIKKNWKLLLIPIGYLVINLLSIINSYNVSASIYENIRLIKAFLLCISFAFSFSEELYYLFIRGIGLSMVGQLFIGLMQRIIGGPIGIQFLGESNKVFRSGVEGLEKGMSGTMSHPGTLAVYSLFVLAMVLFVSRKVIKEKYVYIGAAILTTILTYARTSMLLCAFIIFIGLLFYLYNSNKISYFKKLNINTINKSIKKHKSKLIIGLLMFIGVGFLFRNQIVSVVDRFVNSDTNLQFNSRIWHMRIGIDAYNDRESFAYGANTYTYVIKEKFPEEYDKGRFHYVQPVHNLYVLYLVELGLIGVLIYIALYGRVLLTLFKVNVINSEYLKSIIYGTGIWTMAIMLYNLTGWSAGKDYFIQIMWIVIGLNIFVLNKRKEGC